MIADVVELRRSPHHGQGLFARTAVPRGMVIGYPCERCQVLYTADELERLFPHEQAEIFEHTYVTHEGEVILDCSVGRYMNHACEANVLEVPQGFDVAVRDIAPGEELTCDYRQFADPPDWSFPCSCSSVHCCGEVRSGLLPPPGLEKAWGASIARALDELSLPERFRTGIGDAERIVPGWKPRGRSGMGSTLGREVAREWMERLHWRRKA